MFLDEILIQSSLVFLPNQRSEWGKTPNVVNRLSKIVFEIDLERSSTLTLHSFYFFMFNNICRSSDIFTQLTDEMLKRNAYLILE